MANNALSQGGDMGILGAAAMTGMPGGTGGGIGPAIMQPPQAAMGSAGYSGAGAPAMARREVFCAKCAKKYPVTSNFCPYCGNRYNPCPRCGSDNLEGTKRCVSCGTPLAQQTGAGGIVGDACSRCGTPVTPGTKFCPSCGNKIG